MTVVEFSPKTRVKGEFWGQQRDCGIFPPVWEVPPHKQERARGSSMALLCFCFFSRTARGIKETRSSWADAIQGWTPAHQTDQIPSCQSPPPSLLSSLTTSLTSPSDSPSVASDSADSTSLEQSYLRSANSASPTSLASQFFCPRTTEGHINQPTHSTACTAFPKHGTTTS
jgi:hypothetical protein